MYTTNHHLQEVQKRCRTSCPAVHDEAVDNRTDDQQVGHSQRDHLEELPVEWVQPAQIKFCKTAGGAGEPGEDSGSWEEDLQKLT